MVATWKELPIVDTVAVLSDEAPHDVGTVAAQGVATDASRHDHVHILGALSVPTTALQADCVDDTKIADDAVGSEHIEALSAALDFAGQQATDMVLMASTIGSPPTAVVGKVFCDSSTKKVYVCTAI